MNREKNMGNIKKQVMTILRKNKLNDNIKEVPDLFGIDEDGNYYHMIIDYPGTLYKQIVNLNSDEEFVKYIVKEIIYDNRKPKYIYNSKK